MDSKPLIINPRARLSGNPLLLRLSRNNTTNRPPQKLLPVFEKLVPEYDDLRHITTEHANKLSNAIANIRPTLEQMVDSDFNSEGRVDKVIESLEGLSDRIDQELGRRQNLTIADDFRVHIVSWNVGNEVPLVNEVSEWVQNNTGVEADILAFGFQECEFSLNRKNRRRARVARKRYRRWNGKDKPKSEGGVARRIVHQIRSSDKLSDLTRRVSSNREQKRKLSNRKNQEKSTNTGPSPKPNRATRLTVGEEWMTKLGDVAEGDEPENKDSPVVVRRESSESDLENTTETFDLTLVGQRNSFVGEMDDDELEGSDEEEDSGMHEAFVLPKKLPKSAILGGECSLGSQSGLYVADLIHQHIGVENYYMALGAELGQMRQFIFVKRDVAFRVKSCSTATEATGFGNVATNKGGIGCSMEFNGVKLAFVSCHLAAHQHQSKLRNENCREILKSFHRKLGEKNQSLTTWSDHVFCYGDLNYRLDANRLLESLRRDPALMRRVHTLASQKYDELDEPVNRIDSDVLDAPAAENGGATRAFNVNKRDAHEDAWNLVEQLVRKREFKQLLMVDQLRYEQRQGKVLFQFNELEPLFPPSFKVKRKKDIEYIHLRLPSYCDRILWHDAPHRANSLRCLRMSCQDAVSSSDHKPVSGEFHVKVGVKPKLVPTSSFSWMNTTTKQGSGVKIDFQNVSVEFEKGPNLNGLADPRLVICSSTLWASSEEKTSDYSNSSNSQIGVLRTKPKKNRLDAEWSGKELPTIYCAPQFQNPGELENCSLIFCVWNRHTTQSGDDILGEASLLLEQAVQSFIALAKEADVPLTMAKGKPCHFELPLVLHGVKVGNIRGSFLLEGPQFLGGRYVFPVINTSAARRGCCAIQ